MTGGLAVRQALVLDDEADRREWMRCGLLDHGVRSDEAATVEQAIRALETRRYDLVVCDIVLCDPPGAANPAPRGYLAVCFALTRPQPPLVVQASSHRRWRHPGAVLTNWQIAEVADVVYGSPGIPDPEGGDGGCLWSALERLASTAPRERPAAAVSLLRLPVVRELEELAGLWPVTSSLEDAAHGESDWDSAVAAARRAFFPGASAS
jgi:hypothetical protein